MKKINAILLSLFVMIMTSPLALATETLDERINEGAKVVQAGGNFMIWVVGAAGIVLLFLGIMGLKKYADDSRQNPLMKPMIYLIAGAAMSGFTVFRNILTATATGEDAASKVTKEGGFAAQGAPTTP